MDPSGVYKTLVVYPINGPAHAFDMVFNIEIVGKLLTFSYVIGTGRIALATFRFDHLAGWSIEQ
jgi:hypothetical protein